MVSFSCEVCNDTIKKPKLDAHKGKCRGAYFTCLDCNTTFNDGEHKSHTSCISEAQKYQGALYKPEKGKGKGKGSKSGQEANGKPSSPATLVEKESPEGEVRDIEMADAAPVEIPAVGESSEDGEEKSTKKDSAEKKEKTRKHKKERKERKKEAKKKAVEEAKEESKPTGNPTATKPKPKPKPVDPSEETPTTEKSETKSEKKDKKSKKDRKAKKDELKAVTEVPKAGKAAVEAAAKAVVTESKPIEVPEAPAVAKKSEKKEKKSKAGKKRKIDEAASEPTNGIAEAPETALLAAETKPEEPSPTKKAKKEKPSPEDKDLAESFLAIFQGGHPLTLGKALTRLEKEHDGDARKRLLEIIRLREVKGELVVSIP